MIGFDRSAFAASPDLPRFGNQNVNRVNVRFITKDFRSILPKIRTGQASSPSVVLITRTNLNKRFWSDASLRLLLPEFFIDRTHTFHLLCSLTCSPRRCPIWISLHHLCVLCSAASVFGVLFTTGSQSSRSLTLRKSLD